jgi:hypothetical protein
MNTLGLWYTLKLLITFYKMGFDILSGDILWKTLYHFIWICQNVMWTLHTAQSLSPLFTTPVEYLRIRKSLISPMKSTINPCLGVCKG